MHRLAVLLVLAVAAPVAAHESGPLCGHLPAGGPKMTTSGPVITAISTGTVDGTADLAPVQLDFSQGFDYVHVPEAEVDVDLTPTQEPPPAVTEAAAPSGARILVVHSGQRYHREPSNDELVITPAILCPDDDECCWCPRVPVLVWLRDKADLDSWLRLNPDAIYVRVYRVSGVIPVRQVVEEVIVEEVRAQRSWKRE